MINFLLAFAFFDGFQFVHDFHIFLKISIVFIVNFRFPYKSILADGTASVASGFCSTPKKRKDSIFQKKGDDHMTLVEHMICPKSV